MSRLMRVISAGSVWESASMADSVVNGFVDESEIVLVVSDTPEFSFYSYVLTSHSLGFVLRRALREL